MPKDQNPNQAQILEINQAYAELSKQLSVLKKTAAKLEVQLKNIMDTGKIRKLRENIIKKY